MCPPLTGSLIPPLQAFAVGVRYFAWVDYDGRSGNLEVYLGANASKPSAPSIVGRVNVSDILQSPAAYAAFTGGTSQYWQWPNEHQYIYNLSLQATTPAQVSSRPITPVNSCSWNGTSVRCPGFAGTQGLVRVGSASVGQGPEFPMDLEYWGVQVLYETHYAHYELARYIRIRFPFFLPGTCCRVFAC